jgi:catalase
MPVNSEPPTRDPIRLAGSWALIAGLLGAVAVAFGYTGGWLAPHRLTPNRLVDQLQVNSGTFAGYRRNHAKGVCVTGYFQSNGNAERYSVAQVFASGRTPVVGRFAIPGGNPYAPDSSIPIRSMALRFALANGQQWRTGMNSMPVFPVATPQGFYAMLEAQQPDPATGKPDPKRLAAFFAAHPETAAFRAWARTAKPSASFATDTYDSLDAFVFVDARGGHHAVRWSMVPETPPLGGDEPRTDDANYLANDLAQRLARTPLRWRLLVSFANPGDPINDATKEWPMSRRTIDAGTLVVTRTEPQTSGPCRDINYDPTVLPDGIEPSGDPLLPARSAAYAVSYLRRTSEEAHLPGTLTPHSGPKAGSRS